MNDSQNRYIDPDTGKILDSAQSEIVGASGGALLGSAAINAVEQYNTYKSGLAAQEQIPGLIADTEAMIEKDKLDLELVDLAHKYRQDPSVLDQFNPEARELIRQDIDLLERIHGREEWDRINELPFRERAEMFIRSKKPSYDGYPHRVVEEMKGIYGPRPMHPEVPVVIREEIAAKAKDIDDFKGMLEQPVKFNWKAATPSLEQYKPKNLLGTAMNPYVATGLFVGAMGGKVYDEYNKHKALIEQREMLNEKTAALKLPKLKMPKPKTPSAEPLIPKKVKRVGTLGLGAGVLGYTGVKGSQQFQEGSDLASRLKVEGIAAQTPAERQKALAGQAKVAHDIKNEGMDQHMKTAFEKYEELKKFAGTRDVLQQGIGHLTGGNVNSHQKALEDAIALGDNEGVQQLLHGRVDQAMKSRNIARGVVGAAAGTGAAGAGVAIHHHNQEKTAFEIYEDLEKVALNVGGIGQSIKGAFAGAKQSAQRAGESVKKTLHNASGKEVKKWEGTRERVMDSGMGAKGLRATDARIAQAKEDMSKARKQVGIAAGGLAAGGAAAAGIGTAIQRHNQEKTALEKYEALAKEAGIGNAVKKGVNHLTGKNVKFHQGMVDDSIKLGDDIGTIQMLQGNVDAAKKSRNVARGVAAGTIGAAGAGTTGGILAAKSNGQEKVANDVTQEDSQYALDHPLKKTLADGAEIGTMIGAPIGALAGTVAGGVTGGGRGALLGAGAGVLGGGITGALGGVGTSIGMLSARDHANNKLHEGAAGAPAGALAGGLFSGGLAALSAPASISATGRVAPAVASIAGNAGLGAGIGALVGSNQEKHYNNVHNGEFATNKQVERQQGHQQVAELESDMIEKSAEEVVNELFKEASAVIADDKMEKVAGIQSPISKINGSMFGYDRLK